MKKIIMWTITIFSLIAVQLCGCVSNKEVQPDTLQSITYSEEKAESEYTVMIKENGEYVPYLVLTDNYDKKANCLLLRKYLLDESRRYNENGNSATYYENSEIDLFLNEEYINCFTTELQDIILNSEIEITTYESISLYDDETEYIRRKVFLLSYEELNCPRTGICAIEGTRLKYFETKENLYAMKGDGNIESWWLRTPDLLDDSFVYCISYEGLCFSCPLEAPGFYYEQSVRPAFCLSPDTKIISVDGVNYLEVEYDSMDIIEIK